ncbi:MAG: hypothetical protein REI12_09855 [Pedobacter sp.]|nr:hypothetical protein [Pedobacter sp.]
MLSAFNRPSYLAAIPQARLDELQTGDLVLFSGRTFSARLVQLFTGSYWSHVGIVLRLPEHGNVPLLWEATRASKLTDIHKGRSFDGVQLVSLAEKVASYPGEVVVRRLVGTETAQRRYRRIKPLVRQWAALPYCNFVFKQLVAWWRGHEAAAWQRGGFCSEFVAEVYKHLQLLPADKRSMDYVPRDFSPEAPLPLLRGRLSAVSLLRV